MPRDMAMKRPHARVIRVVLQDNVPRRSGRAALHDLHVASLRVLLMGDSPIPGPHALGQNVEVVSVEMHRVGGREFVLHDETDGGVVGEVVDVPLRVVRVGDVALVGEDEERVVVVGAEGDAVHVEEVVARGVGAEGDGDFLRHGRVGGGGEGEERRGAGEGVVAAFAVVVGRGAGGGDGARVGFFVVDCCEGVGLFGQGAGGAVVGAHPDRGVGGAGGFDDDVCSLADAQGDHVGGVGFYRDEVVGYDGHLQAIDGEALKAFGAGVDES